MTQCSESSYGESQYEQLQTDIPVSRSISIFADNPPASVGHVSAFPIVLHKWRDTSAHAVTGLPKPAFLSCLRIFGRNLIKNTDLTYDWLSDPYARKWQLVITNDSEFNNILSIHLFLVAW